MAFLFSIRKCRYPTSRLFGAAWSFSEVLDVNVHDVDAVDLLYALTAHVIEECTCDGVYRVLRAFFDRVASPCSRNARSCAAASEERESASGSCGLTPTKLGSCLAASRRPLPRSLLLRCARDINALQNLQEHTCSVQARLHTATQQLPMIYANPSDRRSSAKHATTGA